MARKLYLVALRYVKTPLDPEKIRPIFDVLGTWMRLNGFTWFVVSERTADEINEAIRAALTADDSVLVLGIDQRDRAGWLPQTMIDWLNKAPVSQSGGIG